MKAELYKRLFKAIFAEDYISLKKIAYSIIQSERHLGHNLLANDLEKIAASERPKQKAFTPTSQSGMATLPKSKRNNIQLVTYINHDNLKHHMVLPNTIEERLLVIEREFVAQERLKKYNLTPKKKILLHGAPGCGKTLSAERLAWNLGLPLLKVRFDSLISSYFGESASNLRLVFDYCKNEPVVLLLDECDFIAKSRIAKQDVGEAPRIVNMLLTLLDEYDAPGLVIATTNLKVTLDEAIFRRFDDVIEIPLPSEKEIFKLLKMTLSAVPVNSEVKLEIFAEKLMGCSASNVVSVAQNAAKYAVLAGCKNVTNDNLNQALSELTRF